MPVQIRLRHGANSGFTLVEVMVAIAVLAILVGIALPSFVTMIERSRLDSSTQDLVTAMRFARSEAIQRNARISIVDGGDFATGWEVQDSTGTRLRLFEGFQAGVQCTGCPQDVVFNGRGEAVAGTGCFNITDGTRSELYRLYRSGGFTTVDACAE